MKTDPTPNVTGAAGTPLSYGTIQSKRHQAAQTTPPIKSGNAISDTLETSDREPGGQKNETSSNSPTIEPQRPSANGGRLDLTG